MSLSEARNPEEQQRRRGVRLLEHPHVKSGEDVCAHYNVDPAFGLTDDLVHLYRECFGSNILKHEEHKSIWTLFLDQFQDLLARILLGAAFLSFLLAIFSDGAEQGLAAFVEPFVILLILVANAAVSVWQENRAEKSLEALKNLQPELARVLRNGQWLSLPSRDVVPGDICELRVGDRIPADIRLLTIKTVSFRVEQSQLTGEPRAIIKETAAMNERCCECEIQAKDNMLFFSTTVVNGCALGIATSTGMNTEIGKIQSAVQAAGADEGPTPLQKKLDEFGELLSKVIGVICVLVWAINFRNFSEPSHGGFLRGSMYYFKTAVALAVAAIPEGLTAVITTCLALGTRKMAQKNAIVRRLPSVETLGCTTVICSDKTGTLTTNEMSCVQFSVPAHAADMSDYEVEGCSYTPNGNVSKCSKTGEPFEHIREKDTGLQYFALCAALCNDARLQVTTEAAGPRYTRQGEPTEAALKVLVEKLGCPDEDLNKRYLHNLKRPTAEIFGNYWSARFQRVAVLEFSRDRKSMSVLCRDTCTQQMIQFVKGAPESILERSTSVMLPDGSIVPLLEPMRQAISTRITTMSSKALRTLALAIRQDTESLARCVDSAHPDHARLQNPDNFILYEQDLVFCGLVGLMDPPRPEVAEAIKICHTAGIKVVMVTGDNKGTAEAIATMTGIVHKGDISRVSFTGKELEMMPSEERIRVLSSSHGAVFSRTEPKHKQMIIRILNSLGEITAMTGDGVNDAPALKQADIGIAMGITGTEVAKEASDMVLADDNFMSIVLAVEEGRSIYNNMKAFIRYLISSNIGEVASIFFTAALGIPEGLAPVQLLWVNLVTDGFPATALGFNPPDVDAMKKHPRRKEDPLISSWVFFRYMIIGLYVGLATVGIFVWWYIYGVNPTDNHTLIPYWQLSHWTQCHTWNRFNVNTVYGMDPSDPCTYFNQGKIKASTLSLTVLVVIEMFNALNALSEDGSLLSLPPWSNPWLIVAIVGSVGIHCAILYNQTLGTIFGVVPLTLHDWFWVLLWSFPVLLIDEGLKAYARRSEATKNAPLKRYGYKPKKNQ